jgi:hypothetical protein
VVEICDGDGHLFFRKDEGTKGPVFSGARSYTALRVEPHGSVEDAIPLWLSRVDYGEPQAGIYYVRVAFPLDALGSKNQFSVSKAVKFRVPARPKEPAKP